MDVKVRLKLVNVCFFPLSKLFIVRNISKEPKLWPYKKIILPVLLYECQAWNIRRKGIRKLAYLYL